MCLACEAQDYKGSEANRGLVAWLVALRRAGNEPLVVMTRTEEACEISASRHVASLRAGKSNATAFPMEGRKRARVEWIASAL